MEIDECAQCLQSETVIQEAEVAPSCITKHPGFDSLSLDKWSLRFAATNLRTREKQEYRQTGTEDRQIALYSFILFIYLCIFIHIIQKLRVNIPTSLQNTCVP